MRIAIICIGKPALAYARQACEEYVPRLRGMTSMELVTLKAAATAEATAKRLLEASQGCYRIGLDERGSLYRSLELARHLSDVQMQNQSRKLAFLIGPADGHCELVRAQCDELLALSPLTFQHELALVVLLEQLYRASSILSQSPYHRP